MDPEIVMMSTEGLFAAQSIPFARLWIEAAG
jgi:hypothetical protein